MKTVSWYGLFNSSQVFKLSNMLNYQIKITFLFIKDAYEKVSPTLLNLTGLRGLGINVKDMI